MEGPIKSPLSVCLYVCPSISLAFFPEMTLSFFLIFGTVLDNWISKDWQSPFFQENSLLPKFGQTQNGPKIGFSGFFEIFCQ